MQLLENLPADPRRHLKIDVYSFGVTLWEMLSRQRPHSDIHPFQLQARVWRKPRTLEVNTVDSNKSPQDAASVDSTPQMPTRAKQLPLRLSHC